MIAALGGPEHVFESANAAYLDLVGGCDVIGKRLRDALPELEEQGVVAQLDRIYTTGEPVKPQEPEAINASYGTQFMDYFAAVR